MDHIETLKNAENFTMKVWQEADEITTLRSYIFKQLSEENVNKNSQFSFFHWIFDNFVEIWIMARH